MDEYQALSHTTWDCKYHVGFIPKCRRKTLYLELRRHLGEVFRRLAELRESKILEGHLMLDHGKRSSHPTSTGCQALLAA
jgi:putative transposase